MISFDYDFFLPALIFSTTNFCSAVSNCATSMSLIAPTIPILNDYVFLLSVNISCNLLVILSLFPSLLYLSSFLSFSWIKLLGSEPHILRRDITLLSASPG